MGTSRARLLINILASTLMVAIMLSVFSLEPGRAEDGTSTSGTSTANRSSVAKASDVKLLADFRNQVLFSGGRQIDINDLEIEGSAHYQPGSGLAVYKGGVNEIPDPSFEGQGWLLSRFATLDSTIVKTGQKSLRMEAGDATSGLVAELKAPVTVASDMAFDFISGQMKPASRTVSFDSSCGSNNDGILNLTLKAFDARGDLVGEHSISMDAKKSGWQRNGFVYSLPEGTESYNLQVVADNFSGSCNVDAVLSEPKDFFTPYFDGDSENCYWVVAATPQGFHATLNSLNKKRIVEFMLAVLLAMAVAMAAIIRFSRGDSKRMHRLVAGSSLVALPLLLIVLLGCGLLTRPDFWPRSLYAPGSDLQPDRIYYYRVTSVDAQGVESTPSAEARIKASWLNRKITLGWGKDPEAVKYRVYRGESTYSQDTMFEVDGGQTEFMDTGLDGAPLTPPRVMADSGAANDSRSLRPNPDVRISSDKLNFEPVNDFWVAGEVEFGFTNSLSFIPASFFEIGDPNLDNQFAVSTRYLTAWGDEFSKILLIKGMGNGDAEFSWQPLVPINPGSVIKYVAAMLYQPNGDLPAGAHLWYRIDQGKIEHIFVANNDPIRGQTLIRISKRYFYDEFGNNSVARSFAIVQNKVDYNVIDTIMGPDTLPESVAILTGSQE